VNNVDLVIMAERPKLAPYMEQMHTILAEVINIDREQINIKATTTEQLGFVGRGEGIAALATASVYKLY
jgi:2-C-methyl-D-erythritol 2,4-cyclodiphosphate synthase